MAGLISPATPHPRGRRGCSPFVSVPQRRHNRFEEPREAPCSAGLLSPASAAAESAAADTLGQPAQHAAGQSHLGLDRGSPIDRYYIERFLGENAQDIGGRVLESPRTPIRADWRAASHAERRSACGRRKSGCHASRRPDNRKQHPWGRVRLHHSHPDPAVHLRRCEPPCGISNVR